MAKLVFISQPMKGKSFEEIHKNKVKAIREIKELLPEEDLVIIDSLIYDPAPHDLLNKPLWCLGESIKILSYADIIYFAEGYNEAKGCITEKCCAENYGKRVYTFEDYEEFHYGKDSSI